MKTNRIITTLLLIFGSIVLNAQTIELTSQGLMKSNGKIYVVVAVVLVIMIGLFAYVWRLDKKITKLENKG
jgi:CcmD family protein